MDNTDIKKKIISYYQSSEPYFEKLDQVFVERGEMAHKMGAFDVLTYAQAATCVLDVGCGSGALLAFLRHLYPDKQYYGVDVSPLAIHKANEKNAGVQRAMTFSVADVEKAAPFSAAMFDLVILHEVLEHFVNPDLALMNVATAMKPGGILFVIAPNRLVRSPIPVMARKAIDYVRMVFDRNYLNPTIVDPPLDTVGGDSDAVHITNPWELHRMVRKAGLEIVKKSHLKCRLVARKP